MTDAERLQVVAHELRSPVAALAALAEAFPRAPATTRPRLVELAVAAGRDVERLLSDPELTSLRREPVDIGPLVTAYASDAVVVTVDGQPSVLADVTRLRQVIGNLVANGLRHGERVTIAAAERDGLVLVEVVDAGHGVEPGIDPFARATTGVGSSGIGLWLARSIAEAHGGSLELRPGPGGARFRLSLPSASAGR